MAILKSNYKIDPEHLDVIDPDFPREAGEDELQTIINWGRMLRRHGYPCPLCDGSGRINGWLQPQKSIPCGVCWNLCPTCGQNWAGRAAWDAEGHTTIPGGPLIDPPIQTC